MHPVLGESRWNKSIYKVTDLHWDLGCYSEPYVLLFNRIGKAVISEVFPSFLWIAKGELIRPRDSLL